MALLLVGLLGACESKSSGSSSGSAATAKSATTALQSAEPAEPERPTSPFDEAGDPLSGAQRSPGQTVEIPGAKGYVLTVPKGFRIEKDAVSAQLVLIPESGTAKVVVAAEKTAEALDQRVTKLLQESMTREETWKAEKDTQVGAAGLAGKYALGVGYQGFPGGRREPHKLLRLRIVLPGAGDAQPVIQALATWNGADVWTEVAIVNALRGIHPR